MSKKPLTNKINQFILIYVHANQYLKQLPEVLQY